LHGLDGVAGRRDFRVIGGELERGRCRAGEGAGGFFVEAR
jgi:hypothetical protein